MAIELIDLFAGFGKFFRKRQNGHTVIQTDSKDDCI